MKWNNLFNFKPNLWEPPKFPVKEFVKAREALVKANKKANLVPAQQIIWGGRYGYQRKFDLNASAFSSAYVFIHKLEKRGYKRLGQGFYSTVLWKSGDRVIKVQRCDQGPDAWMDYILWASQKGYAGGLAPKVYSYKKIGDFYVAVMEKIDYTARKIEPKDPKYMHHSLFTQSVWMKNELCDQLLDQIVPGASKFKYDLLEQFGNGKGSLDLHDENIMFRSDGSMVVVDPVSHQSKMKVIRLKARDFGLSPAIHPKLQHLYTW